MKKLLLITLLAVSLEAKTFLIEKTKISADTTISKVCVDGWLYYIVKAKTKAGVSVAMHQPDEVDYGGGISPKVCGRK